MLKTLTPREEKVIKMRFGLDDGSEHTLEEVGQTFAVTRERIRQIEAKALRKLRHPSRRGNFGRFWMELGTTTSGVRSQVLGVRSQVLGVRESKGPARQSGAFCLEILKTSGAS